MLRPSGSPPGSSIVAPSIAASLPSLTSGRRRSVPPPPCPDFGLANAPAILHTRCRVGCRVMIFSFDLLINAIVSGILIGGFYAAVTCGVSLSFGILDIVNIAQPAFIILAFERRGQESLRGLAFFFGLLFITEVSLVLYFGVDYRYVQASYIGPTWHFGFVDVPMRILVPCLVSLLLIAVLQLILPRTFIGRAIMAVAQDQLALRLMAVDPVRIKRIAFGISIATASLAGAFLIVIQPVEPSVGREYIGRVFAICVLGGTGSLRGTVIAAMLIGIVESMTATFYGPSWAPAVSFGVLLLTLAVRPAGLLGR